MTPRSDLIQPKYISIIYKFCWHSKGTMSESLSCYSHVAWQSLLNLIALQTQLKSLIHMPGFCCAFVDFDS